MVDVTTDVMLSVASVAESQGCAADIVPAKLAVEFSCCAVFVAIWNAVV